MFEGLCCFLQPYFSLLLCCSLLGCILAKGWQKLSVDPGLKILSCPLIFLQFTPRLKSESIQSPHIIASSVFFHLFTFSPCPPLTPNVTMRLAALQEEVLGRHWDFPVSQCSLEQTSECLKFATSVY